jgi:hypothetical protein
MLKISLLRPWVSSKLIKSLLLVFFSLWVALGALSLAGGNTLGWFGLFGSLLAVFSVSQVPAEKIPVKDNVSVIVIILGIAAFLAIITDLAGGLNA